MQLKFTRCGGRRFFAMMKLTTFILLIACTTVNAMNGYGQKISLSDNDAPLAKVFKQIEKQTHYQFLFFDADMQQAHLVSLHVRNAAMQDVLQQIFKDQPLAYTVSNNIIVVRHRQFAPSSLFDVLPNVTVNGRVRDSAKGTPLVGVTIQIKGSTTGTTTDEKGHFSLNVPQNAVLVVSYLGYMQKEIPVNGRTIFNISLSATTTGLNQLVVIGYGSVKKENLTGAVSSVDMGKLPRTGVTSVSTMLQGQVPGLLARQSGAQPGASTSLLIRGAASPGLSNAPLIVIDGFPLSNSIPAPGATNGYSNGSFDILNSLNPNDIASITVLKDASATAIYGARAANGVILITQV